MGAQKEHLKSDELNLFQVIAMSVAIMAPVMAMAMNVGLMAADVGYSVGLVFLISIVGIGFVAISFIKFNQVFSSAGSVYTFVKKSLGETASAFAGWLIVLEYWSWSCGCSAVCGALISIFVQSVFGINLSWMVFGAICLVLIWYVNYTGVKLSSNVMLVVEAVNIVSIVVLAIIILIKVGSTHGLSWAPLAMGKNSFSGLGLGMVFAVLSYGGFEGASSLGEESKNPKKYIPIALASTVIGCGLIFIFVSYAEVIGFGISATGLNTLTASASTIVDLSKQYIGTFFTNWIALGIAISAFSCALGSMTAGSRALYSMAQDGFAPKVLGRVHQKLATPDTALHIMLVGNLILMFAMSYNTGTAVYGIVNTAGALACMVAYAATSLGSMILFGRRGDWTWQLIFPFLAMVVMAYCFWSNIYPVPSYPYNILPYVVIAWLVVGMIITAVCRKNHASAPVLSSIEG
jgi:amino acid transporter